MTLYDACDIGYSFGLDTIEECVTYIQLHSINIFPYDNIYDELTELHKEIEEKKYKGYESVELILGKERMEEITKTVEEFIFNQHGL